MVGSSVDGAEAVEACGDALVDIRGHDSVSVRSTVNTFELTNWSGVGEAAFLKLTNAKVKRSRGSVVSNEGRGSITT